MEHSNHDTSEVCRHLTTNTNHKVNFAKPDILSSAGDSALLLIIIELLFIGKYEPLLIIDFKALASTYSMINFTERCFCCNF